MLSVKTTCEITENGIVTLQLPRKITPGIHEVVVVIDEPDEHTSENETNQAASLMKFAGSWKKEGTDAVSYQRQIREDWS